MTDPIADYLTRIRNALQARYEEVEIPASKMKIDITRLLKDEGYINDYQVEERRVGRVIRINLKYADKHKSVISGLRRISKSGRRTYVKGKAVPRVLGGMGTAVMSTSQGVMSGHEAMSKGIGGEVVAHIW